MNKVSLFAFLFLFSCTAWSQEIQWYKSLLIKNTSVLKDLENNKGYDMGMLLGELGEWAQTQRTDSGNRIGPGRYVQKIFSNALREQNDHTAAPSYKKLGGDYWNGKYPRTMKIIFDKWKSASQLNGINSVSGLKGGPFRLIAVVNRMDRAGDIDDRGTSDSSFEPRALGEIHLVYSLDLPQYEKEKGEAFPMTFVLAYRLPPIKWSNGKLVLDKSWTQFQLIKSANQSAWKGKMQLWAKRFQRLSGYGYNSGTFRNTLKQILDLSVRPENFLALRSNTKINRNEFELREWYVIQTTQDLIKRKPRREFYSCLSNSDEITKLANHYWMGNKTGGYNDMDVTTIHATQNSNKFQDDGKNGYTILRDNNRDLMRNSDGSMKWSWSTCPKQKADMPFGMYSPGNNGAIQNERLLVIPNFGRIKNAGPIWKINSNHEHKRHAVAIRTCTGCHSQEGATRGFHIHPPLAGKTATLSPYLLGRDGNTFSYGGKKYTYRTLATRKAHLVKFINRTGKLFDSLKRPELGN